MCVPYNEMVVVVAKMSTTGRRLHRHTRLGRGRGLLATMAGAAFSFPNHHFGSLRSGCWRLRIQYLSLLPRLRPTLLLD